MNQEREGRVDKKDIEKILDQTDLNTDDVYSVLWALVDLGYDCVKRDE